MSERQPRSQATRSQRSAYTAGLTIGRPEPLRRSRCCRRRRRRCAGRLPATFRRTDRPAILRAPTARRYLPPLDNPHPGRRERSRGYGPLRGAIRSRPNPLARDPHDRSTVTAISRTGSFRSQAPSLAAASTSVPRVGTTPCSVMICARERGVEPRAASARNVRVSRGDTREEGARKDARETDSTRIDRFCLRQPRADENGTALSPFACTIFQCRGCGRSDDGATWQAERGTLRH